MGCDSISSITRPMVNPFGRPFVTDENGEFVLDGDGNALLPVATGDIQGVVAGLMSGVTKMFLIYKDPPVVATTAGAAKLNNKTMNVIAQDFCIKESRSKNKLVKVESIANSFLKFMRKEFNVHYAGSKVPEEFREGPEFLVGGYGRDDVFPSLYRLRVKENNVIEEFSPGQAGLSWNGQSDSIERIILGYDSNVKAVVEAHVQEAFEKFHEHMTDAVLRITNEVLERLGAELPLDIDTSLPARVRTDIPWNSAKLSIDFSNMPLQNAIDFVSWLVLTESGRMKFARGLPTVGGRTHIGVVTKADGLRMLGEPELEHRYTGFAHDL